MRRLTAAIISLALIAVAGCAARGPGSRSGTCGVPELGHLL